MTTADSFGNPLVPPSPTNVSLAGSGMSFFADSACQTALAAGVTISPPGSSATVVAPLIADADTWGVRQLMNGMKSRTRIIQIAIVLLCVGMYIMMRKFHD